MQPGFFWFSFVDDPGIIETEVPGHICVRALSTRERGRGRRGGCSARVFAWVCLRGCTRVRVCSCMRTFQADAYARNVNHIRPYTLQNKREPAAHFMSSHGQGTRWFPTSPHIVRSFVLTRGRSWDIIDKNVISDRAPRRATSRGPVRSGHGCVKAN